MAKVSEAAKKRGTASATVAPPTAEPKPTTRRAAKAEVILAPVDKPEEEEEDLEDDDLETENADDEEEDEGDDIEDGEDEDEEDSDEDDSEDEDEDEEDDDDFLDADDDDDDLSDIGKGASKRGADDPASFSAKRKKVRLDFQGADDKPPAIAAGEHNARVSDVEYKESAAGNPMLEWVFKITSGPHKNADLRFWSSMKQDARWASARVLKALGIPVAGKVFELDPEKIIGKPCKIVVVHDNRNEDFPHKINKVLPADAAAIKANKAAKDLI